MTLKFEASEYLRNEVGDYPSWAPDEITPRYYWEDSRRVWVLDYFFFAWHKPCLNSVVKFDYKMHYAPTITL